jgi:hypothetical protein
MFWCNESDEHPDNTGEKAIGGTVVCTRYVKVPVLHTHMRIVVKHRERIPNVPHCFGSSTHEYAGWLGVTVLLAGLSIYLVH